VTEFASATPPFQTDSRPQGERPPAAKFNAADGLNGTDSNQLRRSTAFRQVGDCLKTGDLIQVEKNFLDRHRVFNTDDYCDRTTAFAAGVEVNLEYPP